MSGLGSQQWVQWVWRLQMEGMEVAWCMGLHACMVGMNSRGGEMKVAMHMGLVPSIATGSEESEKNKKWVWEEYRLAMHTWFRCMRVWNGYRRIVREKWENELNRGMKGRKVWRDGLLAVGVSLHEIFLSVLDSFARWSQPKWENGQETFNKYSCIRPHFGWRL